VCYTHTEEKTYLQERCLLHIQIHVNQKLILRLYSVLKFKIIPGCINYWILHDTLLSSHVQQLNVHVDLNIIYLTKWNVCVILKHHGKLNLIPSMHVYRSSFMWYVLLSNPVFGKVLSRVLSFTGIPMFYLWVIIPNFLDIIILNTQ